MGFWTFGGGKKQDGTKPSRATPDDMARFEKVRAETYDYKRDLSTKAASRDRTASIPQPPRSQTAPVLTESRSAQNVRAGARRKEAGFYRQVPTSELSLDPENLPALSGPPTLFAKRSNHDSQSPRPRSSKRKAEEIAREKEIRAMTSSPIPIPKRPATYRSESPLLRETRQIPGGSKRYSSEVSLPLPGSLSNIDFNSAQNSFKIGMIAALSPRPNIQYDAQARATSGKQPARAGLAIQKAIEEEDVSDLKRIDELADDLDAGGLRELMERDRKRREKKREADKERLLRRLERRAIKDREDETRRARTEAYVRESSPANVERRRGRKNDPSSSRPQKGAKTAAALKTPTQDTMTVQNEPELEPESMMVQQTEVQPKDPFTDLAHPAEQATTRAADPQRDPFADQPDGLQPAAPAPIRNVFEDEPDMDLPHGPEAGVEGSSDVDIPARSPLRQVAQKFTPAAPVSQTPAPAPATKVGTRSSLSQTSVSGLSKDTRSEKTEEAEQDRKASGSGNVRLSTWTNFFSKGTRRKLAPTVHESKPETSFSNASRESVQRKALPPVVTDRTFRRSSSGTPQRTMSRFREDLPELPVSESDAQAQSPTSVATPIRILDVSQQRIIDDDNEDSYSFQRSIEAESRPTSTTAAPLPQSMASVDSEASWLSGRPSKRVSATSGPSNTVQRGPSGAQKPVSDDTPEAVDEERPTQPGSAPLEQQATTTSAPEEGGPPEASDTQAAAPDLPPKSDKRNSVRADARRRPTIVNQGDRIQSHAGLLNDTDGGPEKTSEIAEDTVEDHDAESPGSVEIIEAPILRAHSVEYKGHARAVSAGSAKLLDIRRVSTHSDLGRPRSPALPRKSALGAEAADDSTPGTPTTVD